MATGMDDFLNNFVAEKMEEVENQRKRHHSGSPPPLDDIPLPTSKKKRKDDKLSDNGADEIKVDKSEPGTSPKDANKSPKSKPIKLVRNKLEWYSRQKALKSKADEERRQELAKEDRNEKQLNEKDKDNKKTTNKEEEEVEFKHKEKSTLPKNIKDIKICISDEVREVRVIKVEKKDDKVPELGKDVSAKVVDDLFKEFLAKKLDEVETDHQKSTSSTTNGDAKPTKRKRSSRKYRTHSEHSDGKSEDLDKVGQDAEKKSRKKDKDRKSSESDSRKGDKEKSSRQDKGKSSKRSHKEKTSSERDSGKEKTADRAEAEKKSKGKDKGEDSSSKKERSHKGKSKEKESRHREKDRSHKSGDNEGRSKHDKDSSHKGPEKERRSKHEKDVTHKGVEKDRESKHNDKDTLHKEDGKLQGSKQNEKKLQKAAEREGSSKHEKDTQPKVLEEDKESKHKESSHKNIDNVGVSKVSEQKIEKEQTSRVVIKESPSNGNSRADVIDKVSGGLSEPQKGTKKKSSFVLKDVSAKEESAPKGGEKVEKESPSGETTEPPLSDTNSADKEVAEPIKADPSSAESKIEKVASEYTKHEKDAFETVKAEKAPTAPKGFKLQLGFKISDTSAALISSGIRIENDPKKAALEEGECTNTEDDDEEDSSDEEDEDEDGEEGEAEDGEIESDDEEDLESNATSEKGSGKKKKKSKKHKHKHKKKKKKKSKEGKEKDASKKKSSHSSRSKSPKKHKHSKSRSRSRSKSFDKKTGVWRSRSNSPKPRHGESTRSHERMPKREDFRFRDPFHRGRSPDRDKDRRRARSRSRSAERSLRIDKTRLREIAIANAYANMQSGSGPRINLKPDELAALKAGGKSVEELTDFCKKISEKEADDSSDDSDEKPFNSEDEDAPFIHHPFKLRDPQPNIVMNIRNAKQLPVMTPGEKAAATSTLRLQFPVSSGSHHRLHENVWVPVEKTTATPTTTTNTSSNSTATATTDATVTTATTVTTTTTVSTPAEHKIFPDAPVQPIDIGSIVSERLKAVRKLQDNPHDVQAMGLMYKAQQKMNEWAASKQLPGHFTGSTGVQVLSQKELADKHHQAWAKKDTFHKAAPISGGIGRFLLQKMGWKEGTGLGKNNEGNLEPLALDVKCDRKGLTSADEVVKKTPTVPLVKDLSRKHPVSALVELCNKRRWGSPEFVMVNETGPDHQKNFLFKVKINGTEYQPSSASSNKKNGKALAATVCLQALGLVPRDPPQ